MDELIAALGKEIVGGPHPAVVAGEQQAGAFAARARSDLLEHNLRETMKRVSQLEESEKTASALVRPVKEQVAQLDNRGISLQEQHQSTNSERDSWSTERIRLNATIRDKERVIVSMTADYHRDAGNRQLVMGRCYELTAQVLQLSDAVAMAKTSAHQLLKLQLIDKDNKICRLLCTIRMSPVVSEYQRRSPLLVVAAMLGELVLVDLLVRSPIMFIPGQLMPGLTAAELSAFRSASDTLRQAGLGIFGDRGGPPSSPTWNTIVRRPRSPSVARFGTMRWHSPDSDADSSGSALISSHASSRSVTSSRSHKKALATPTPSPVSSKKSSPKRSTNKKVAKSRATVSHSPSEDSDDEAGLAPLRRPRRTAAANCSAWSPGDSDSAGGDSTGGGSAATSPNLSNKLVESSYSSGDGSTLADPSKTKSQAGSVAGSGSPPLASPTVAVRPPQVTISAPVSAAVKAPVSPKPPPPARSPVRSATSTPKSNSASKAKAVVPARPAKDASKPTPASKAKPTAAIRSAKDGSKPKSASKPSAGKAKLAASDAKTRTKSYGGVPPHHVDFKVLVARAAASARLDSRESGPMKCLRELPFYHKGSKRCWEKIMSSCAVSATMEKTADGERIKPTPCSTTGLAAFMDVDDSGHPWRSVLRLLPHSLFFVDDWSSGRKGEAVQKAWLAVGGAESRVVQVSWSCPVRHPSRTLRTYALDRRVQQGADSEMVAACVEDERLIAEPEPPALHPDTPAPVNRPGEIELCPPTIVHSA
ncbi:unnamed protein product [Phytophthora fragariaefolia]|uniref:Unnamed protein product n=1 Tax=Phytophthora fragariaefolia TaxID=1490495 RepID=A0A9W6Y1V2_9STRA|nr:unnamed protein product [Phytophthora fragariaefolia]